LFYPKAWIRKQRNKQNFHKILSGIIITLSYDT